MSDPEAPIEILDPKTIKQKPELFVDDGIAFDAWLPHAVKQPETYAEALTPNGLVPILDDLLRASANDSPNWTAWKHASNDKDIQNFRSEGFVIPATREAAIYRLSVLHPFRDFTKGSINLEIKTKVKTLDPFDPDEEVLYIGQQAIWTPGLDKPAVMELLNYPVRGNDEIISPDNELGAYWDKFVKAAVAAHAIFVEPTTKPESA